MTTEKYRFTKCTVECYKLRAESSLYWANITIDAHEGGGRIQIASDFGAWQNYWGAASKSFKEFLIGLDMYYAAGKFGADQWFDQDATIIQLKQSVLQHRRSGGDAKRCRELFDEIKVLEESSCKGEFDRNLFDSDKLLSFVDGWPDIVTDVTPQFKKFWETAWQAFIEILKKDVEEEKHIETKEAATI